MDNVKFHFQEGTESDIGKIFEFRVDMTATGYNASDTTYDLVVLEGVTVTLLDSSFNDTKLKRVAS